MRNALSICGMGRTLRSQPVAVLLLLLLFALLVKQPSKAYSQRLATSSATQFDLQVSPSRQALTCPLGGCPGSTMSRTNQVTSQCTSCCDNRTSANEHSGVSTSQVSQNLGSLTGSGITLISEEKLTPSARFYSNRSREVVSEGRLFPRLGTRLLLSRVRRLTNFTRSASGSLHFERHTNGGEPFIKPEPGAGEPLKISQTLELHPY